MGAITVVVALFIVSMVVTCSQTVVTSVVEQNKVIETRAQNAGVVPGEELLGTDGRVYNIVTFPDRPGIECINHARWMACYPK